MRCSAVRKRLVPLLLGELEEGKEEVEAHLEGCPRCSRHLDRLRRLVAAVEESLGRVPEAAGLVERVMETVRRAPPAPAPRRSEVPPIPLTAEEAERRIRQRSTAQLLLAAAVALAMLVLWAVMPRAERPTSAPSSAPAAKGETGIDNPLPGAPPATGVEEGASPRVPRRGPRPERID